MITPEEFYTLADEVTCELPAALFDELNGGVNIVEYIKIHPGSDVHRPMFILGEYVHTRETGRSVFLYYGSFCSMLGDAPAEIYKARIRKTVRHEFRHHIESLAGEYILVDEDNDYIEKHRRKDKDTEKRRFFKKKNPPTP